MTYLKHVTQTNVGDLVKQQPIQDEVVSDAIVKAMLSEIDAEALGPGKRVTDVTVKIDIVAYYVVEPEVKP